MASKSEKIIKWQDSPRDIALRILCRVEKAKSYSGRLLYNAENEFSGEASGSALLHQIVKGTLQWKSRIDSVLERYLRDGIESVTPRLKNILRIGVFEVMFLDRVPKEVSVNAAVEMAKKYSHKKASGLVNGVLRNVVRDLEKLKAPISKGSSIEELATWYAHPKWIVERWVSQIGLDETIELCEADNRVWPLCFRTNTLKVSTEELRTRMKQEGIEFRAAQFCPDGTIVEDLPENKKIHDLEIYKEGLFIVQDESSALVSYLVSPKPDEIIIDLCSAPGGKTTHLAALMKNKGRIIAADTSASRLRLVMDNCKRLGVAIVEPMEADGAKLKIDFQVDRILVDAPCSGLGVLGRKTDARWNKSADDFQALNEIQLRLLVNAAKLLKNGGRLVYSTCSIDIDEDEEIVKKLIQLCPGLEKENIVSALPAPLVTSEGYFRSWPHKHQMGGAFAAVLKRIH